MAKEQMDVKHFNKHKKPKNMQFFYFPLLQSSLGGNLHLESFTWLSQGYCHIIFVEQKRVSAEGRRGSGSVNNLGFLVKEKALTETYGNGGIPINRGTNLVYEFGRQDSLAIWMILTSQFLLIIQRKITGNKDRRKKQGNTDWTLPRHY